MKTTVSAARPVRGRFASKAAFVLVSGVVAMALAFAVAPTGLEVLGAGFGVSSAICPDRGPISASALPHDVPASECDLSGRTITDGVASVVVPARGTGVQASAATWSGTETLTVETERDGTVRINPSGVTISAGSVRTSDQLRTGGMRTAANPCGKCAPACSDRTFALYGYHWDTSQGPFPWYFNRSTTPTGLTADQAAQAFIAATNNVVTSRNQCGIADKVNVTAVYRGDTSHKADVSSTGACTTGDGMSVIDFGLIPAPGLNCSWYNIHSGLDSLAESDIRMQSSTNWTTNPGKSCNNKFDLEGLASHERGHTFGLAHPDVATNPMHGNLTMSTYGLGECSKSYRTYGLGDVLGLQQLYP